MNKMTNDFAHIHYATGTAAGVKGNSDQARANSQAGADKVGKDLARRHAQMMAAWTPYGERGAKPEQIAADLGLPVHIIRPRAGELAKRGLLFPIGKGKGELGCYVTIYSIVRPEAQAVAA